MFRSSRNAYKIYFLSAVFLLLSAAAISAQNPEAKKIYQQVKENILQIGNAQCVSDMTRAISLDQTQAEYYYYRGFCFSLLDKDKEALADYDQALKLNPALLDALYSRSYLFAHTDRQKAIPDLKRIIEIDPKQSNAYGILASYYLELGKYDDAFAMGQKVNELVPEGGAGYRYEAESLARRGKYADAIPLYSEAIKRTQSDTQSLKGRAEAYRHVGDTAAAEADERAVAELAKNSGNYSNGRGTGGGMGAGTGNGQPPMLSNPRATGDDASGSRSSENPKPTTTVKILPLKITRKPVAGYTEDARKENIQGRVLLKVAFLANGKIGPIRVISGLPNGLTDKAIEAAKLLEFQPELHNGVPVTTYKNIEYTFVLY